MSNITPREQTIKDGLVAQQKIIQSLFGDKEKSNKFMATAVKVANDYKLSECHPNSIVDACVTVAQLNLDLSPALSQAYLVPFKPKKDSKVAMVQLIISARGYTALLARQGWNIKSFIVNEADDFHYRLDGFDDVLHFERNLDDANPKFKYAVAMAKSPNGELFVEVMNHAQIEKHRKVSSNQNENASGVWSDWTDMMQLKTVVKKLAKKLPLGEEIATAVYSDDKVIEAEIVKDEPKQVGGSLNDL